MSKIGRLERLDSQRSAAEPNGKSREGTNVEKDLKTMSACCISHTLIDLGMGALASDSQNHLVRFIAI